jgi:hypothetical protein
MPQPYNVKTTSSSPDLSKVKFTAPTRRERMINTGLKNKRAIAKGGVEHYNDALQGNKRPLF